MKRITTTLIVIIILLVISNIYFMTHDAIDFKLNINNNASSGEYESGDSGDIKLPEGVVKDAPNSSGEVVVKKEPTLDELDKEKEVYKRYDVIVFDAEPEGIVTAISAARNGKSVLLVEKRDGPGGLMTYGMLNTIDMNTATDGTLLSQGIFEEFYNKIGRRVSFDVEKAKKAFEEMIDAEKNITTLYNAKDIRIGSDGSKIEYAIIDERKYTASMYVDCNQDADITVAAGGKYVEGWEDINEKNRSMSATLVIKMDGVDWDACCKAITAAGRANTGYTDDSIWAFGDITQKYVPSQPHIRLKGLNIGRQDDGSVLINSLQIINADMLDAKAKEKAYDKCVKEAEEVAKFIAKNVPGFKNAKLVGVAPELYVRETRHIVGEHILTVKEMLESTYSYSAIAMASYPIDVQTTSIYDWGYIIGNPNEYYIPMATIVPKGFKNLMTIGRSGSYTSIAAGSARVIPTGMTLGQSAGIMAAVCIDQDIDLQDMINDYTRRREVKSRMSLQGVYIDDESKPVVNKSETYYNFIIEMCELGILSLGYDNQFDANKSVTEREFIVLMNTYLKRNFVNEDFWNMEHINLLDIKEEPITPNRAKEIMYDITTYNIKDENMREKVEDFIEKVAPVGNEQLNLVRVYEILRYLKDFLKGNS